MAHCTAELTRALSRGEQEAFERFYRSYFDWMYRVAVACTRRDESFCLDVVQDAVLRVVRSIQPMESEAHFENWLRVVVRTCALDRLRAEQRRTRREQTSQQLAGRHESNDHANGVDQAELVAKMLTGLDPQLVRLIELRYTQGHTLARIAQAFQSTTGAIDSRLRKAIERLRRDWSDEHGT